MAQKVLHSTGYIEVERVEGVDGVCLNVMTDEYKIVNLSVDEARQLSAAILDELGDITTGKTRASDYLDKLHKGVTENMETTFASLTDSLIKHGQYTEKIVE